MRAVYLKACFKVSGSSTTRRVSFEVACLGLIIARRVSEGPTYVASAASATNPSLTRRVMNDPWHSTIRIHSLPRSERRPSLNQQPVRRYKPSIITAVPAASRQFFVPRRFCEVVLTRLILSIDFCSLPLEDARWCGRFNEDASLDGRFRDEWAGSVNALTD